MAINRTSFVEAHERVSRKTAADFLRRFIEAVPYKVHTNQVDRMASAFEHEDLARATA